MTQGRVIVFGDIVEKNGKTIRENNREIKHNLKVGDLVEFEHSEWLGDGASQMTRARMFIVNCGRDCDGTPLYSLSPTPRHRWDHIVLEVRDSNGEGWRTKDNHEMDEEDNMSMGQKVFYKCIHGMPEYALTKIEITEDLLRGVGALHWPRKEEDEI